MLVGEGEEREESIFSSELVDWSKGWGVMDKERLGGD